MPSASPAPSVRVAKGGRRGQIVLDRPAALNALTTPMVRAIHQALRDFERDPAVQVITMESTRAGCFCAGGDIRAIRTARLEGRHAEADDFFAQEFALNLAIAECAKPIVSLIDGICMGGGLGLSVHGAHRVVSDRLVMAMPETAIGYFPDVGATYFLNTLPPGETGLYIALTGERLSWQDALYCRLATACVPHEALAELSEALGAAQAGHETDAIETWRLPAAPGAIEQNRAVIDACFAADRVEDILSRLERTGGDFAAAAWKKMRAASPASLNLTLFAMRGARGRSLAECLATELDLARQITRGADFNEGVRAMLVDKDRQPSWAVEPA